jgi:hypothetical protein
MRRSSLGILICTCVALAAAASARGQGAQDQCTETEPSAPGTENPNEIAPSARRPTLDVALADDSARQDQLNLPAKTGTRFTAPLDVSIDLIDAPTSEEAGRLDGTVKLAAAVNASRTRVVTIACVDGVSPWDAGRYEGTILISGPRFADFLRTRLSSRLGTRGGLRCSWWSAVLILVGAAGVFFAIAFVTNSLIYQNPQRDRQIIGSVIGVGFALVAIASVYWSSYVENPTWGANIGSEFLALGVAGFTAATAGLAAAHRLLGRTQGSSGLATHEEDGTGDEERPAASSGQRTGAAAAERRTSRRRECVRALAR